MRGYNYIIVQTPLFGVGFLFMSSSSDLTALSSASFEVNSPFSLVAFTDVR
eukprot:m.40821 g.40821  ORF g.40821 m.40821 type:complete len:51 (+) comp8137_c0_seq1:26-178(+)